MRILLYGMQSSGASTIALLLAQKKNCIAYVDIWNMFAAPEIVTDHDVVAKAVVTTAYPLEVHKRRFKPDLTALILRHPVDNYLSLMDKYYAHESGLMHEKFSTLEDVVCHSSAFDCVVYYEDLVFNPASVVETFAAAGWSLCSNALEFPRTGDEIASFNTAALPGMGRLLGYGTGNFRPNVLPRDLVSFSTNPDVTSLLLQLCPTVVERYEQIRRERGEGWTIAGGIEDMKEA